MAFLPRWLDVYNGRVSPEPVGALSETVTYRRFTELVDAGFSIEEISSTDDHLVLGMETGGRCIVVRLAADDVRPFVPDHATETPPSMSPSTT